MPRKKGGATRLYSVLAGSRTQFASIQKASRLPRLLVGESKLRRSSGPGSERTTNSTNSSAKKLRSPWSADLPSAICHLFQRFKHIIVSVFSVSGFTPCSLFAEGRIRRGGHLNRA